MILCRLWNNVICIDNIGRRQEFQPIRPTDGAQIERQHGKRKNAYNLQIVNTDESVDSGVSELSHIVASWSSVFLRGHYPFLPCNNGSSLSPLCSFVIIPGWVIVYCARATKGFVFISYFMIPVRINNDDVDDDVVCHRLSHQLRFGR